MAKKYSVEELMTDDSFINYSFGNNKADIEKWERYLINNPQEKTVVEEAKKLVVSLNRMLRENSRELDPFRSKEEVNNSSGFEATSNPFPELATNRKGNFRYIMYAAASIVILVGVAMVWRGKDKTGIPESAGIVFADVQTAPAEKKVVWLPDSTKVILNAKSQLKVASDFGENNRIVTLTGEAFFDVTHNKQKPFIVQMPAYEVRVLGTAFNVKAYPEEATSETSLVRGSIEIVLKNDKNRKFLLKPNEKAILASSEKDVQLPEENSTNLDNSAKFSIKNVTIAPDREGIAETAWTKNKLEIMDQSFDQLKPVLERWFGVEIHFNDDQVKSFRYTATFEDESIEQVLNALKLSYNFQYSINNKNIYISRSK